TSLEDFGIKLRALDEQRSISLEHDSKMIDDSLAKTASETAANLSLRAVPVLSYLANSISAEERSIPYSLVTALDQDNFERLIREDGLILAGRSLLPPDFPPPIILNEWAALDLGAKRGAGVSLEYYYWHEDGRLETKTAN